MMSTEELIATSRRLTEELLNNMGFAPKVDVVCDGNRVDVTAADLLGYWENDPNVRVILLYLETVGEPQEFVEVARRACEIGLQRLLHHLRAGQHVSGHRDVLGLHGAAPVDTVLTGVGGDAPVPVDHVRLPQRRARIRPFFRKPS